jgi:acyl carrier protein
MNSISTNIRQFVIENFLFGEEPAFTDEDSFLDLGIIDSTGVLELVTFVEGQYHITIDDAELVPDNLDSIAKLVRFIQSKCTPCLTTQEVV